MTIRVLVVDDSALIRQILSAVINAAPDMECVGTAADAYVARDLVNQHAPDVITLDIEMPRMDGLTFLDKLMRARPTPVVMISTLTEKGAEATLRAMELGAVSFIAKPKLGVRDAMAQLEEEVLDTIRAAFHAKLRGAQPARGNSQQARALPKLAGIATTEKLIAIGASTGGTEAIKEVLLPLPSNMPAIVITQHMPGGFTRSFAKRLDSLCALHVKEAEEGERILPGRVYIAPGGRHFQVIRSGANYQVALNDGEPVNRHRPSVDVLFDSIADIAARNTVAVLLTGMGKDGAIGMKKLRAAGAHTIAQDAETSLVYGMPRAAVELGACELSAALDQIPRLLTEWARKSGAGNRI